MSFCQSVKIKIKKCGELYCTTLLKRNLQLKHTEFFLRFIATMLCHKQHTEIDLDDSKILILMLKIKNTLAHRKSFKMKNWRQHDNARTHVAKQVKTYSEMLKCDIISLGSFSSFLTSALVLGWTW